MLTPRESVKEEKKFVPVNNQAADDAQRKVIEAELKFVAAQKRKASALERLRAHEARDVNPLNLEGITAGHVRRVLMEAERLELQKYAWQAEKDEQKLFYEMQLAREAYKKAEEQRKAYHEHQAAAAAELNAEKDRADEFNKARRASNARIERLRLEEQKLIEEANMEEIDRKRVKVLEEIEKRQAEQQAILDAKKKLARAHIEEAQKLAQQRQASLRRHEEKRKQEQAAQEAILRAEQEKFRKNIEEQERVLKETREKKVASLRPSKGFMAPVQLDALDDGDEEIVKQKYDLNKAYRLLATAEEQLQAKQEMEKAAESAFAKAEQEELVRIAKQTAAVEAQDQREIETLEAAQRQAEVAARRQVEDLALERQIAESRIATFTKQLTAAKLHEEMARQGLTEAEQRELALIEEVAF